MEGGVHSGDAAALEALLDRICLSNLLESATELIYFKDLQSRFMRVSQAQADRLASGDLAAVIGRSDAHFHDEDHARKSRADEIAIMETGRPMIAHEEKATYPVEGERFVETTKQALRDASGAVIGTFGISRDITSRKQLEVELACSHAEQQRLASELITVLESTHDPIARFDTDLRCVYANRAAAQLTHSRADPLAPTEIPAELRRAVCTALDTGVASELEHTVTIGAQERYFHTRLVPEQHPDGRRTVLTVSRDFTERKRAEETLAVQATHDPLTGLANRMLLQDRMERALIRLERHPGLLAVLFVDLDHFKQVNDVHGHVAGDALLIEVARRLDGCARRGDTVSRFGGDEFVLLCEGLVTEENSSLLADRVAAALRTPFVYLGSPLFVSASIGVAICSASDTSPPDLLASADRAMYAAKRASAHRGGLSVVRVAS